MNLEPETSIIPRERQIFLSALDRPPSERAAFLEEVCRGDEALRRAVSELFSGADAGDGFLEEPVLELARSSALAAAAAFSAGVTEKPGDWIGRYKLLQKIGEGGCGVVYMAEQEEPVRRRVALKVIKLGMDTKSVIARFEAERQAIAMMDHPNIAKVFDAGATATGRPYFVMELVRGIRITEYCDQNNLTTDERIRLIIQVCYAIQHAHQKGIIHRDIKPSNILVTLHDGLPVPKVIDFGIVKATATEHRLTNKTLFTEFTAFIGTPAYMSPEQAEMSGLDIDTRSDIYSLGVLLYEILTGKTPFDAEQLLSGTLDQCRRTILEQDPVRPSTRLSTMLAAELTTTAERRRTEALKLIHLLRGDLDWVVMKGLEKDRTRRYATANDLASDLQRYLDSEPVLARPPSKVYRLQKLLRRHRGAFAAAAAVAGALILGAGISVSQAIRARKAEHRAEMGRQEEVLLRRRAEAERERAELEKRSARLNEYVADINLAQQSLKDGNFGRAAQLLEKHRPDAGSPDLRGFEWRYLWGLARGDEHSSLPGQDEPIEALAFSPDGGFLAVGLSDKLRVWNLRTREVVTTRAKGVLSLAFTADGQRLITASPFTVRIWNTSDWTEQQSLPENSAPIALSTDGRFLATSSRQGVRVWETSVNRQVVLLPGTSAPMAFSPDGKTLAADTRSGITLWNVEKGTPGVVLADSTNLFFSRGPLRNQRALAFSPDGQSVVGARNTPSDRGVFVLSIWDARTGEEKAFLPNDPTRVEHTGMIWSIAFSPDGQSLVTASMDHSLRLWDLRIGRATPFQGHLNEVWSVAFSPDGQTLASGAKDGGIKLWPIHRQPKDETLPGARTPLAFSRDSRTLVATGNDNKVLFFNLATHEPDREFQLAPRRFRFPAPLAISADLRTLVEPVEEGQIKLWNTETGTATALKAGFGPVDLLALSPDGRVLVSGQHHGPVRWWDLPSQSSVPIRVEAHRVLFSSDGKSAAFFDREQPVQLWDVETRSARVKLSGESEGAFNGAFSADGRMLATVTPAEVENSIRLWDVKTGKLLGSCTGHKQGVFAVAFSPDGRTLASSSDDGTLRLWNVATHQEVLSFRRLGGAYSTLLFSPDGSWLGAGSGFGGGARTLSFYRAPLLSEIEDRP